MDEDIKNIFKLLNKIVTDTSSITTKIITIDAKLDMMDDRLDEMEIRISTLEDHEEESKEKMADMEKKLLKAWDCVKDLENRSRRNNVCIMGLPEGIEDGKPIEFLTKNLPILLDLPSEEIIEIELAHRTFASRPKVTQRPCPIIVRFLKFQMRELILKRARKKEEVIWENSKLAFFQDLSKEKQNKWKAFIEGKKQLRELGVKYTMVYSVILRVIHKGQQHSFHTSEAVITFIQKNLQQQEDSKNYS
uniref:L1 transposable element RRM domain-containing protein n=1 Tax=Latimeria chalumnae TaxID=7897 RepID=H3BD89_LATCH